MTATTITTADAAGAAQTTSAEPLAAQFARRGYVILRGVLDADEVARARELCTTYLTGTGSQEMMTSDFLADRFLAGIALRERVVRTAAELLGDRLVLYPNCTARKNVYVPWHVDATFVGPTAAYVWEPGFAHAQCGLYLQDNDPVGGGGIDVVRGSHLMSFDGYGTIEPQFEIAARTIGESDLRERVDTRAGDVVIWNARLLHTSTAVLSDPGREKFGVFFSYARRNLRDNHRFLSQIAVDSVRTMNGVSRRIPRLAEIARLRPQDLPAWFAEQAAAAAVRVPTL